MKKARSASLKTAMRVYRIARGNSWLAGLACCVAFAVPGIPNAEEAQNESPGPPSAEATSVVLMPRDDYCANIVDLAADARLVLQTKTLEELQAKIDEKLAALESKRAELEKFLKKRDEAAKETQKGLVDIFSKMKPDVAAAQLEILDVKTSASILKQLNARAASTILNEMKAPIAAAITVKMAEPVNSTKLDGGT